MLPISIHFQIIFTDYDILQFNLLSSIDKPIYYREIDKILRVFVNVTLKYLVDFGIRHFQKIWFVKQYQIFRMSN